MRGADPEQDCVRLLARWTEQTRHAVGTVLAWRANQAVVVCRIWSTASITCLACLARRTRPPVRSLIELVRVVAVQALRPVCRRLLPDSTSRTDAIPSGSACGTAVALRVGRVGFGTICTDSTCDSVRSEHPVRHTADDLVHAWIAVATHSCSPNRTVAAARMLGVWLRSVWTCRALHQIRCEPTIRYASRIHGVCTCVTRLTVGAVPSDAACFACRAAVVWLLAGHTLSTRPTRAGRSSWARNAQCWHQHIVSLLTVEALRASPIVSSRAQRACVTADPVAARAPTRDTQATCAV